MEPKTEIFSRVVIITCLLYIVSHVHVQRTLIIATVLVTKDFAVKSNLLL